MNAEFSFKSFFEPGDDAHTLLESVLVHCVKTNGQLCVEFDGNGNGNGNGVAMIRCQPGPADDAGTFVVKGRWRSAFLRGSHRHVGALLQAPFLFSIRELRIPACMIFTMGRPARSAADFWMRNYFHATVRGERLRFVHEPGGTGSDRTSRELAKIYLWILRQHFTDGVLKQSNAAELLVANAHVALGILASPLLEAGAAAFRHRARSHLRGGHKETFLQLRERAMALYET